MMVPSVKRWKITLVDGRVCHVMAPTRRLAILNLRHEGEWSIIKTVGVCRKRPICTDRWA